MDNNKVNKKLENFKGFFKPKGEKSKEVIEAADSTAVNRKGFFLGATFFNCTIGQTYKTSKRYEWACRAFLANHSGFCA